MRTTFKVFLFAAALLMGVSSLQAQTTVAKYAGDFMATGFGSRGLAMGGAHVAAVDDITSAYWNPAGLMRTTYPEIGLMHEQRFGGLLSYNYGGVAWPFGEKYTLALSITRSGVDDIADTRNALIDLDGNGQLDPNDRIDPSKVEYFSATDWVGYLTYAYNANDRLALGVNLKLLRRDLHDENAMGVGFDIGAQYRMSDKLMLGASVQDVTTTLMAWSTGRNELVSPTVRVGAAYAIEALGGRILPTLDLEMMGEGREFASTVNLGPVSINPHVGLEYRFRDVFALRGGLSDVFFDDKHDSKQLLTFGAGIHLPKLYLDYAFGQNALFSEFKDASHRISLRLVLEEKKFSRTE
ncbi:PorV/PorQ family protein [bacterium]|nr:PorV/PorQ family protein [bacterium]